MPLHQGRFKPRNPQKYKGDVRNIIYRSSWELKLFMKFDEHKDVLEWSSEEITIPYRSPVDGRVHRYFTDAYAKIKDKDGNVRKFIIEVKPKNQTTPPKPPQDKKKLRSRAYINQVHRWAINQAKWESARLYCESHGMEFQLMTEDNLGLL